MAGRGPAPKHPSQRKRTNKPAEFERLAHPNEAKKNKKAAPKLPKLVKGKWHPMVVDWWESIWKSPMAAKWLDSDVKGGLFLLAMLQQDFWTAESASMRMSVLAQIRMQEPRFGLTPLDRTRLRWEVPTGDETGPQAKPSNPPTGPRPWDTAPPVGTAAPEPPTDPRNALSVTDGGMARRKKAQA